ncbi:MAG: GMC family oxidoreductase [Prolixibacteraceae bacterium]|nr:GMC family oxidoreductase [Prolixibacteraceae bacterium]
MEHQYDYVIVGSGFGGSVCALRLAEKGYKVLVIEKGKWYRADDFAKNNWQLSKWLWMPLLRWFGIMKISFFRHITIISGVGVGGGSLVYANTLPVPKQAFFRQGSWAKLADWESILQTHYKTALQMLGANKNPKLFDGDNALKTLSIQLNREHLFEPTDVAVYFGKADETVPDPYFNGKGPERAGCNFCGGCMTGCRYNAKNTLDKNYLYLAQQLGVEIQAQAEVIDVLPVGNDDGSEGYQITCRSTRNWRHSKTNYTAGAVVFSGGVLGTIKLLLKLKKKSLPNISPKLGDDIRTNNETLISVTNIDGSKDLSKGIAIGSILHSDDNSHLEVCRYVEGSGFWRLSHLPMAKGRVALKRIGNIMLKFLRNPLRIFKLYLVSNWGKRTAVLLFMQTVDSTLRFKRSLSGGMVSRLSKGSRPTPLIPESMELANQYSKLVNGENTVFLFETFAGIPSTAHILGGAVMGASASEGVIDQHCRVFGYKNMLIVDGSMISANPGVNPSLSITAIAEHAMAQVPSKKMTTGK